MLLYQESMDDYNSIEEMWVLRNALPAYRQGAYAPADGKYGGGAIRAGSLQTGVRFPLLAPITTNHVRAAWWFKSNQSGTVTGNRPIFGIGAGSNICEWQFYSIGSAGSTKLGAARFDDDLTPGTTFQSNTTIGDNSWHHIEVELIAHNTTGLISVWIDGVADTGIQSSMAPTGDTSGIAGVSPDLTDCDYVRLAGCSSNTGSATQIWVDDPIVWDDTGSGFTGHLPDMHRIRATSPSANGAVNDFTPSTGTNYECVDDSVSDTDTTFVETSTVGDEDRYSFSAIGYSPGLVYAAIIETNSRRTGIKAMNIRGLAELGGTTDYSDPDIVSSGYFKNQLVLELAPDGAAWTAQKAIACEFGMEYES